MDGKLESQAATTEETVARAVEAATAGITARIASLEDTVLTLAEALLLHTGTIARPGRVEEGTTVSDFDEVEAKQKRSVGIQLRLPSTSGRPPSCGSRCQTRDCSVPSSA